MASPPDQTSTPLPVGPAPRPWQRRRFAIGAAAGAAVLGLLVAVNLPATATQNDPAPTAVGPVSDDPSATDSGMAAGDDPESGVDPVAKPRKPKPATMTRKARNVPAFPRDRKHTGKRIVYDKALMTVWLINKHNEVVEQFPVVGRWDRPAKGTYRIYSKSPSSSNPFSKVTFDHMVRFAWGPDTKASIGFHSIPRYYDGTRMHAVSQLGLPIARGGCVRLSERAAEKVYAFADVGDLVVVLPSP